jgi:hypothetical protein
MVKSVERIERDIAALEEAVSALSVEFRSAYESYLTALGQAARQQLILASYHLCTHGHPDNFLGLSFTQRQKLQQAIRKLGQRASDNLIAHLHVGSDELETSTPQVCNPKELAQWQQKLEQAIANTLKTLSRETNHLLQQTVISPNTLPSPLLEAAASSEASNEVIAGPPNLLNLLIDQSDEASQDGATHIVAIHLRLSEIEFADAALRAKRNQIRTFEVRTSSLEREYHKKQKERAVAEAEAAWRASWFEE